MLGKSRTRGHSLRMRDDSDGQGPARQPSTAGNGGEDEETEDASLDVTDDPTSLQNKASSLLSEGMVEEMEGEASGEFEQRHRRQRGETYKRSSRSSWSERPAGAAAAGAEGQKEVERNRNVTSQPRGGALARDRYIRRGLRQVQHSRDVK
uniref:uncharacterized protein isoform X2 n=1 Tax=Pristiophorus japonicus TaxID=55135 RepID=UPI00398F89FA